LPPRWRCLTIRLRHSRFWQAPKLPARSASHVNDELRARDDTYARVAALLTWGDGEAVGGTAIAGNPERYLVSHRSSPIFPLAGPAARRFPLARRVDELGRPEPYHKKRRLSRVLRATARKSTCLTDPAWPRARGGACRLAAPRSPEEASAGRPNGGNEASRRVPGSCGRTGGRHPGLGSRSGPPPGAWGDVFEEVDEDGVVSPPGFDEAPAHVHHFRT
jgi:hypothetical protein